MVVCMLLSTNFLIGQKPIKCYGLFSLYLLDKIRHVATLETNLAHDWFFLFLVSDIKRPLLNMKDLPRKFNSLRVSPPKGCRDPLHLSQFPTPASRPTWYQKLFTNPSFPKEESKEAHHHTLSQAKPFP